MEIKNKNSRYALAQKRVKEIKGFYIHLTVYLVLNLISIIKNTLAIGWVGLIKTVSTLSFLWGVGVIFHWYKVFGKNLLFGKEWEKRKIKKILEKDKN